MTFDTNNVGFLATFKALQLCRRLSELDLSGCRLFADDKLLKRTGLVAKMIEVLTSSLLLLRPVCAARANPDSPVSTGRGVPERARFEQERHHPPDRPPACSSPQGGACATLALAAIHSCDVQENSSLLSLSLAQSQVATVAIASAIEVTLPVLCALAWGYVMHSLVAFGSAQAHPCLTSLDLSECGIADSAAVPLINAVSGPRSRCTLRTLKLQGNLVSKSNLDRLTKALVSQPSFPHHSFTPCCGRPTAGFNSKRRPDRLFQQGSRIGASACPSNRRSQ